MKLASYNIQYGFGLDGRYDLERIVASIANADIIALQEVTRGSPRNGHVDMVAAIDQRYSTDVFFTSIKKRSWAAMCSYAHSGLLQITRRFTGDEVKPNYGDGEILEVLNAMNIAVILVTRMFFMSVGRQHEADEVEKMMAEYVMPEQRSDQQESCS